MINGDRKSSFPQLLNPAKAGTEAHTCNPSYSRGKIGKIPVQTQPGEIARETLSCGEKGESQRAGGVA
jgi:hypothetical protein